MNDITRGHLENPSASPHTLLTVSGICLLNSILIVADVDVVSITFEKGGLATISAGLNEVLEQSQLERILN